jgi:hypothetical protein
MEVRPYGARSGAADERRDVHAELTASRVYDLEDWMRDNRTTLSRYDPVAKAMDYMHKDWPAFTAFLADGLTRINDIPQSRLHELLPWNWVPRTKQSQIKLAA